VSSKEAFQVQFFFYWNIIVKYFY